MVKCLSASVKIICIFSVEGLHAIVVTDRDGVPVVKGERPNLLYLLFLSTSSTQ